MKRALLIGSAVIAMGAIAAPVSALDVDVSGRVRVTYKKIDITDSTVTDADAKFSTDGRVDFTASAQTCCLDYGAFVRFEFEEADTDGISENENDANDIVEVDKLRLAADEIEAHVFLSGATWGKLQLGTGIDADQDIFDTSVISAGPVYAGISVGRNVDAVAADGVTVVGTRPASDPFDPSKQDLTSVVYTTPSFGGIAASVEVDEDADWAGSVKYSGDFSGFNLSIGGFTDSDKRMAGMAVAGFGDIKVAGYAGKDDTGEKYYGGALNYTLGALAFSAEASVSESDGATDTFDVTTTDAGGTTTTTTPTTFIADKETDFVFGAAYTIAPGLVASASYFQTKYDADNSKIADSTGYAARLTLNF